MDKYLIINADDFGMCQAENLATIDLFEKGGITSSTIMMPCAWAPAAVKFSKENPQHAVGVHLTTTSEWGTYRWRPVSSGDTSSLVDDEGYMHKESDLFEEHADLEQVEREIRAQIDSAIKLGLDPSHVDNHMGSLYGIETGRLEILETTIRVIAEYKLPFRFPSNFTQAQFENETLGINIDKGLIEMVIGNFINTANSLGVLMPDYLLPHEWNGPQKDSYENFREYLYDFLKNIPNGVTETYLHPALECDEIKAITGSWKRRAWEHKIYSDPKTRQHIEACGIELISYRDLKRIKG